MHQTHKYTFKLSKNKTVQHLTPTQLLLTPDATSLIFFSKGKMYISKNFLPGS